MSNKPKQSRVLTPEEAYYKHHILPHRQLIIDTFNKLAKKVLEAYKKQGGLK